MQLNFINTVTIISLFQSAVLSVSFLIKKEKKHIRNVLLSLIAFVFSLQIIFSLSINYWSYFAFSGSHKIFYLIYQTAFLISPLYYLYIKSVTETNYRFKPRELFHFLPFAIFLIVVSVLLYGFDVRLLFNYTRFGIILHSLIYILISLSYIKSKGIKFASFRRLNTAEDFIKILILFYIIFWVINVQIFAVIKFMTFASWCAYVSSLYALTVFVLINSLYLLVVVRPDLFVVKKNPGRTLLEEQQKNRLYEKLMNYMTTEKPFLEPALSIRKVGEDLNIPVRVISQIINEEQKKNFNDFMNTFRVKESKKFLQDEDFSELTIQEIFYRSGFNSKSTFNLVFKKHTGLTPLEYRKEHLT